MCAYACVQTRVSSTSFCAVHACMCACACVRAYAVECVCACALCVCECVRVCSCVRARATWKRTSRESASKIRRTPRFRAPENIVFEFVRGHQYSTYMYIIYACMHARMDVRVCVSVTWVYVCVCIMSVANYAQGFLYSRSLLPILGLFYL